MNTATYELTAPAELQQRSDDDARAEALAARAVARLQQIARAMGVRLPGGAS